MHQKTEELKGKLRKCKSFEDALLVTHKFFKGEDCYLFATGPSFSSVPIEQLKEKYADKLVVCVKQTFEPLAEICDFHFWNCSNMPVDYENIPYRYLNGRPIIVASSNYPAGHRWSQNQQVDFFLKIPLIEEVGKENCLCFTRNYDDYLLKKSSKRTVGPGIMLESVLHFLVHFGVKSINTLGWDLDEHNSHFYDDEVSNKGCEIPWDIAANAQAVPSIKEWLNSHSIVLNKL